MACYGGMLWWLANSCIALPPDTAVGKPESHASKIKLVECRTLEGEPERSACTKEQLHSYDRHQNVTGQ